jgi:hypothetical protein
LVGISCVKNEIDVIEPFVRHTLARLDHLLVLDNGSTDGTLEVLRRLEREGLPIEVLEDRTSGYYQSRRMTMLMNRAVAEHGAAWVVPVDADELLMATGLRQDLGAWSRAPGPLSVRWRTYVPDASDDLQERNPFVRLRHRLAREAHPWAKVLVPAPLVRGGAAVLLQGSHALQLDGKVVPGAPLEDALLAHFPIRSPGQFAAKIAIGRLQYLTMPDRDPGHGFHYVAPFDLLVRDPESFLATFADSARRFAAEGREGFVPEVLADPFRYLGGPLRYTPAIDDRARPLSAVLAYAAGLAERFAELSKVPVPKP